MSEAATDPVDAVHTILNNVLGKALREGADTIHFEPTPEDGVRVRFRVRGALFDQESIPESHRESFRQRIKTLAHIVVDDMVHPQDGPLRFMSSAGITVTGHLSTLPCLGGEKIVLALSRGSGVLPLDDSGMEREQIQLIRSLTEDPATMLLVTGPWGSGKTATIYSLAGDLNNEALNVVSLEDPIEVVLPDVTQTQVMPRDGLTFAAGMRAILRQDPDIVVLGELHDFAEAEIALDVCLQGRHRVITGLAAGSAQDAIQWLLDSGLSPDTVAQTLSGVVVQRLVARVCQKCAVRVNIRPALLEQLNLENDASSPWVRGRGCEACNGSGYRGRIGIYEIIAIDKDLRNVIRSEPTPLLIKKALRKLDIPSLQQAGIRKARAGITTLEEVLRVTS